MAPDRTILHLFKKNPRPPSLLKNYDVHTIKPQLRPCICIKIHDVETLHRHYHNS